MKHNRTLGGIGIAYHASMLWISVTIIVRMVVELFSLNYVIGLEWYEIPDVFCDVYSLPFMLLTGLFIYKKHTGLCDSVNLSREKRLFGELVITVPFTAIFALWDMLMVDKIYIHMFKYKNHVPKLFLEKIYGIELEGVSGFIILMIIYLLIFWGGYGLHHLLKDKGGK